MEVPTAFRELAEKGVAQAKENYEKVKSAAEQATDVLEDTYSTASKGCASYGLKLIETARANSDATFDLFERTDDRQVVFGGGRAFQRLPAQAIRHDDRAEPRNSAEHAQKVATETAEPIKESISRSSTRPPDAFCVNASNSGCEARTEMSGLLFLGQGAPNGRLPKG